MYRVFVLLAFGASVAWMYTSPGYEPFIGILITVGGLLRDEIHALVGAKTFSLTPRRGVIKDLSHAKYSFTSSELVNPLIIADLKGWLSDTGEQVIAVDVSGANESNRYFADELQVSDSESTPVVTAKHGNSSFSYQYLGRSWSGIHLLNTWESGGGSGVFCNIMLVTLSAEPAIQIAQSGIERKARLIVKMVASIPLGDRYDGRISYRLGLLTIGRCEGRASIRTRKQRILIL